MKIHFCRMTVAVAAVCFTLPLHHASADIRFPDKTNSAPSARVSQGSGETRSRTPAPSYSSPRVYSGGEARAASPSYRNPLPYSNGSGNSRPYTYRNPTPYSNGSTSPRPYSYGSGYTGERIRRTNDIGALPTNPGALPTNQGTLPRSGNYNNPQISIHSYNNGYNNGYNNNHNNYDYHSYGNDDRRHHHDNDNSTVIIDPYLGAYPYDYSYPYGASYPYGYSYPYYPPQPDVVYVPQQPQVVYVPEQPPVVYAPDGNSAPIDSAPATGGDEGPDAALQSNIPLSAAHAITDIQEAWTIADEGLLQRHIDEAHPISVYKDGRFDHTASAADYAVAAKQSFDAVLTQSFVLNHRVLLADGRVKAYGRHIYYDGDNHRQMVFVCYWLQPVGDRWIITTANAAADADHLMMDPPSINPSNGG